MSWGDVLKFGMFVAIFVAAWGGFMVIMAWLIKH